MPEGDTIFRAATALRAWLGGRVITDARSSFPGVDLAPLIGRNVNAVESVGKNLLMTFTSAIDNEPALVLHTHMKMTGSWHVYPKGTTWQRPRHQARLVLEAGDRLAVCFNVPVVALATEGETQRRSSIAGLGPDVLALPLDLVGMMARIQATSPTLALGELLLDQRIAAGIGNIYRCEAMFLGAHHPWTPRGALSDVAVTDVIETAALLMHANLGQGLGQPEAPGPGRGVGRSFGSGPNRPWVYRRAGLPCRRCGTSIASKPQGQQARVAYWCPTCQPVALAPYGEP